MPNGHQSYLFQPFNECILLIISNPTLFISSKNSPHRQIYRFWNFSSKWGQTDVIKTILAAAFWQKYRIQKLKMYVSDDRLCLLNVQQALYTHCHINLHTKINNYAPLFRFVIISIVLMLSLPLLSHGPGVAFFLAWWLEHVCIFNIDFKTKNESYLYTIEIEMESESRNFWQSDRLVASHYNSHLWYLVEVLAFEKLI